MTSIPTSRKLAISSWVNDQFESASPRELRDRPHDVNDHPHWKSDPASGVTGEVYLAERVVYYYSPDTPPRSGWWDMGRLPGSLRRISLETRQALDNLKTYLAGGNEAVQYAFSFLADLVTQAPAVMIGGIPAGSLPPDEIVSDPNGSVFAVDPSITGTFAGSITPEPADRRVLSHLDGSADHVHHHGLREVRGRHRPFTQRPLHVRHPPRRCRLLRPDNHEHLKQVQSKIINCSLADCNVDP